MKFLDSNGLTKLWELINIIVNKKVDKVSGKGLSTNDYTTAEKNKLAGIEEGAEVNQNTFTTITVDSTDISAKNKLNKFIITAGSNITLTPDVANDKMTIAAIDTKYNAGTGISLNGTTFNHNNNISAGTVSDGGVARTLTFGGVFNIPSITYDAQGHITGISTTKITMPGNPNSDKNVTQTTTSSNLNYPLLLAPNSQTTTTTTTTYFDSGVTLNPSTNTITANLNGNANSATKLQTGRSFKVNLGSANFSTTFNGTKNIDDIGVSGILSIANGGTGATTAAQALANLGGLSVDLTDAEQGEANLINADTLGGVAASNYVRIDQLDDYVNDILLEGEW